MYCCGKAANAAEAMRQKSRREGIVLKGTTGRGERIRTSGLYVPNVALYQAKLHPDVL
jgi:hypothetical protein